MNTAEKTDDVAAPPSLTRLDDAPVRAAGEGEFARFPPPPDAQELRRLLAQDEAVAERMRAFGWITG